MNDRHLCYLDETVLFVFPSPFSVVCQLFLVKEHVLSSNAEPRAFPGKQSSSLTIAGGHFVPNCGRPFCFQTRMRSKNRLKSCVPL